MAEETKKEEARSAEGALKEATIGQTVGLVAGVLGFTAIIFGFVLYALDPGVAALAIANGIFGIFGIGAYAATNRRSLRRVAGGRSTAFIVLEVGVIVGAVFVAALVNYYASQNPKEWDLTRDGIYTLHEQSVAVASGLKKKVTIYGFFRPGESGRSVLEQAVALYKMHTEMLEIVFVNPDAPPQQLVEKFDLNSQSPRIVISSENGQFAKLRVPTEEGVTNALIKVAEKPPRKAYFLTGHQEPSIDDHTAEEGYSAAASSLRNEGFQVETLSMVDKENVPKDATLLVLGGARSALFPNEVEAIKAWLNTGGAMIVLLEPGLEYGLDNLFRPLGVRVTDDLVLEPNPASRASGFGPESPVIKEFEPHPITNKLRGAAAFFFRARSVQPKVDLARLDVVTLIRTGPTSWGEVKYREGEFERGEGDVPGPVPIAIAVTKNVAANPNKKRGEARIVVFGDMHFINNRFLATAANGDLFLNSANWAAGDEDRITIRPKAKSGDRLTVTQEELMGIMFFSVNLMPLLILGLGFSVWAIRRRK